ncbi:hypothetical protein GCM10010129_79370 [Streptomyces fumigatiscleroticus]|nr:hypothetical protein GCM10010129_79370 [Streptomyces fumigatiscleroticus]
MSTLSLLVILLLVLVALLLAGGIAYVIYRHPSWGPPLGGAIGAVMLMATLVAAITAR